MYDIVCSPFVQTNATCKIYGTFCISGSFLKAQSSQYNWGAGCAYFAAREMATEADIVFCPYSYILDPIIRSAMEVNIKGAIIVLDEAQ
jgi:Rad3-related DNA helicase